MLPIWKMDEAAIERNGLKVDGEFVHQNVGNMDPVLIYSKDAMHQSNPKYKPSWPEQYQVLSPEVTKTLTVDFDNLL